MVDLVGIGLKATLKIRKLLILLDGKSAENAGFAQPRYTRGTRTLAGFFLNLRLARSGGFFDTDSREDAVLRQNANDLIVRHRSSPIDKSIRSAARSKNDGHPLSDWCR
jgi:hypothetical protein